MQLKEASSFDVSAVVRPMFILLVDKAYNHF